MAEIKNPEIIFNKHFIDGNWLSGDNLYDNHSPSDNSVICQVPAGSKKEIDHAVAVAKKVFYDKTGPWRKMSPRERGDLLTKVGNLIDENVDYLTALESYDNGKPWEQSKGDVEASACIFRYYGGAADKVTGQVLPADGNCLAYTRYEPVGVCGAITPWNYPILMASIKIAPCLAMGNTLVLKPSEETPLTALFLASLLKKAGLPNGVFNIVIGTGIEAGLPLVQHEDVKKITFTGSTAVGKLIQTESAKTLKRCSLELGGKSPIVVFDDADLDQAVLNAHNMIMINQGQCCIAGSRVFVHEKIYDEFVERSGKLAESRKVGCPLECTKNNLGPIINTKQYNRILELIDSGVKEGAKLVTGGKDAKVANKDQGHYVLPTVFADVTDDMRIAREEIFGPVQSIFKFSSIDEVIKRANDTQYGLGAAVFSKDITKALKVAHEIEAGQTYINCYFESMAIQMPFGGFKQSGIGREFGMNGLDQYREVKTVVVKMGE